MTNLTVIEQGNAEVIQAGDRWILHVPPTESSVYSNAMVTSYHSRQDFSFRPYTRMELTAHLDGALHGTAGFGFWNHPYGRGFRLPRAVWFFFSSPPSDMTLAMGVPGRGFKASVFDAQRLLFYFLLPLSPVGILLMKFPVLYRSLWPVGQRAIGVDEHILDAALLEVPRRYAIEWEKGRISFQIDDVTVFVTRRVPQGKLGFVAWIDNQYAIVTPQGRFGFGILGTDQAQRLVIGSVMLTTR